MTLFRRTASLAALAAILATPLAATEKWVVHLPSSPMESASRQAAAFDQLTDLLAKALPGLEIEPQIFRRLRDAKDFLEQHPAEVGLLLCDAAALVDLPSGLDLVPTHRMTRSGKTTYRRLVVAPTGRVELRRLADLAGKSIAIVEVGDDDSGRFLSRSVFANLIEPKTFFRELKMMSDDTAAINEVLFQQVDAALVADFNPLLEKKIGPDLRVIYTSDELSMPVLAISAKAWSAERRPVIDRLLSTLGDSPAGRVISADLGVDGFAPIPESEQRALRQVPTLTVKSYELAMPGAIRSAIPAPPAAQDLPLSLDLGLPKRPSFGELVDALSATEPPPKKN